MPCIISTKNDEKEMMCPQSKKLIMKKNALVLE